jgi:cytidylate kinase
MILTIQGPAGSGKGTVAKILSERLGYKKYSAGDYRRLMAKKIGMTLEEFNKLGEKESFTDEEADEWMRQLGLQEDNFVMDGRLGFHFIPNSVKIYLDVNDDVSAERIFEDNKNNPERINQTRADNVEEQKRISMERDASDIIRYRKWYGIEDFTDRRHYDIVIDTSDLTIEQVIDKIIDYLKGKKLLS